MAEENMKIVDLINEKEVDLKKHNDSEEAAVEAEAKVPEVKQESESLEITSLEIPRVHL